MKKLFLTAKVLALVVFLSATAYSLSEAIDSKNTVLYRDLSVYKSDPERPPVAEYFDDLSPIEKNLILADKNKSFAKMYAYNQFRLRNVIICFVWLLGVVVLEKWFFWLIVPIPKHSTTENHKQNSN